MHWNIDQILWALVLAGHLVLLVVLIGRERASRFPWFTAAITFSAISLLADHLLNGKVSSLAFYWQSFSAMALQAILGILVLFELCRIIFSSGRAGLKVKTNGWLGWGLVTVCIAVAAVWAWGPWPSRASLDAQPAIRPILLMQLFSAKSQLLAALLTVQVALLIRIFGRRFGFGWKSHASQISIGLSTNAICILALQVISDVIKRSLHFNSRAEMQAGIQRLEHLFANLDNARFALWIIVLIWWIVWLWRDETGAIPNSGQTGELLSADTTTGQDSPLPDEAAPGPTFRH